MSQANHNANAQVRARQDGLSRSSRTVQLLPFNTELLSQHFNHPHTAIAPESNRMEKGENARRIESMSAIPQVVLENPKWNTTVDGEKVPKKVIQLGKTTVARCDEFFTFFESLYITHELNETCTQFANQATFEFFEKTLKKDPVGLNNYHKNAKSPYLRYMGATRGQGYTPMSRCL